MAAVAKDVVLSLGLVSAIVNVEGAVEAEKRLVTLCTGSNGNEHSPTKIEQKRHCATCGEVAYADLKKGREVEKGSFVVVEQDEVAEVRNAVLGTTQKLAEITLHDAAEVESSTLQGEKVYYLAPANVAQVAAYSLIYDTLTRHPDKAAVLIWTARTRPAWFRVKPFRNVLAMEELVRPESVRITPNVDVVEPPEQFRSQIDMIVKQSTQDFDPAAYADDYAARLTALLDSKEAVEGVTVEKAKAGPRAVPAGGVDLSAALAQMLAKPTEAPKPKAKAKRKEAS